jgi:oligosaccharide repeat unit polymerase
MLTFLIFALLACCAGAYFWYRIGTVLSPPALASFSFGGASALAILLDIQVRNGATLHAGFTHDAAPVAVIYATGLVSFLLPWLRQGRLTGGAPKIVGNLWRTVLQLSLVTLLLLTITWGLLGHIPVLSMASGNMSIVDHLDSLKTLPVGLMMINLLAATVLALYFASAVALEELSAEERIALCLVAVVLAIAALWQGNRQLVLIALFFAFARYMLRALYDRSFVTLKRIVRRGIVLAICVAGFVIAFSLINVLRLSALGVSSGPFELALYYTWPVYNMASIHGHLGYWGSGEPLYLMTELLPARLGGKDLWADLGQFLFEPTSPSGYFSYWYLSFGLPGVAVGGLAFGSLSLWIFRRCLRSENWMQVYVLTAWTCATISVYSHILTAAYFALPLVLLLVMQRISRLAVLTVRDRISAPLRNERGNA